MLVIELLVAQQNVQGIQPFEDVYNWQGEPLGKAGQMVGITVIHDVFRLLNSSSHVKPCCLDSSSVPLPPLTSLLVEDFVPTLNAHDPRSSYRFCSTWSFSTGKKKT